MEKNKKKTKKLSFDPNALRRLSNEELVVVDGGSTGMTGRLSCGNTGGVPTRTTA